MSNTAPFRILIADKVSLEAVERLKSRPELQFEVNTGLTEDQLCAIIGGYHGLIVRSSTQVTPRVLEAATSMRVVGRAGVGVDNINVEAATRRGVLVMNTPEGNITSAAEHAVALLLSLVRNIPRADALMRQGEWAKSGLTGVELCGKTLLLVGLGKVGKIVARALQALDVKVMAFDPYVTPAIAAKLGVELATDLFAALGQADLISVHTPLTETTRNLLGREALTKVRKGVFIVNAARGGIIDEAALAEALKDGRVGGAALDVFDTEPLGESPLRGLPNVILTPHLGASTHEAQRRVAVDVVDQIAAYLLENRVVNAVNMPPVTPEVFRRIQPYLHLLEILGSMHRQLAAEHISYLRLDVYGPMSEHEEFLLPAVLQGLLGGTTGSGYVNPINAAAVARERGLNWTLAKHPSRSDDANLFRVTVTTNAGELDLAGVVLDQRRPRIVEIDGFRLEAAPYRHMLLLRNRDVPGVVGRVGTILGNAGVNIGDLRLGRKGSVALSFLSVDSPPPADVVAALRAIPGLEQVTVLHLPMVAAEVLPPGE